MSLNFKNSDKFFGDKGLTSTSANFIANKAKEIIEGLDDTNIGFVSTLMSSMNSDKEIIVERGMNMSELEKLIENKRMIIKLNSLISWLREAVKSRENMLQHTEHISFNVWMRDTYPDVNERTYGANIEDVDEPENNCVDTNTWAVENMNIKEMNEYFYLLAAVSTLGKFIHPSGEYAKARDNATKLDGTSSVKDMQSNTVIYKFCRSIDKTDIENKFFELQEMYRDYQKRLNAIKFNIENNVLNIRDEYSKKMNEYSEILHKNELLINAARQKYVNEFTEWKIETLNNLRRLKIIIPNDLQDVYEMVNGKR